MTDRQNVERLILVVGATGKQGGAVARSLLDRGFQVRGLTRNPHKPEAQALTEQGAEVVQGDMDDRSDMDRVLDGPTAFSLCRTSGRLATRARFSRARRLLTRRR